MEIKEFYGDDILKYRQLATRLFHYKNNDEDFKRVIERDKNPNRNFVRFGIFENGNLLAALEIRSYEVIFNNRKIKMGGIAEVISALEARGKGAVKELFRHGFEAMRKENQLISHLYPFRGDYYRQYGYEATADTIRWSVPVELIKASKIGYTKFYDGSADMQEDIKTVYAKFIEGKNLAIASRNWENFFNDIKPYDAPYFSCIHYTDDIPDGFVSYDMKKYDNKVQDIFARDFWYIDKNGLSGLLNYFYTLKDYTDRCFFVCNDDVSSFAEFTTGCGKRNIIREIEHMGSTRIVDAEAILKLKAAENADITIQIYDEYCPCNNDIFTINNGTVTRGGTNADAAMSIGAFSSLIMGRYSKYDFINGLEIKNPDADLTSLFPKCEIFTDEHF